MNIRKQINKIDSRDTTSLILYLLYRMTGDSELQAAAELPFVFDKGTLDKILEFYGGRTIHIPTKDEFMSVISALVIYDKVDIHNGNPIIVFNNVREENPDNADRIIQIYTKIKEIIKDDEFVRQSLKTR